MSYINTTTSGLTFGDTTTPINSGFYYPQTHSYFGALSIYAKEKQKPKVVFDGDYTIYHDEYGVKTVVKRMEGEQYDKEKAVMYALLKSKDIKPKDIAELINNSVDNKAAREKRKAKKLEAKKKNNLE